MKVDHATTSFREFDLFDSAASQGKRSRHSREVASEPITYALRIALLPSRSAYVGETMRGVPAPSIFARERRLSE
jgi:hypothetical protein